MQKKRGYVKKSSGRIVFGEKEKKRLFQLGFCICLFMAIFFGRGNALFQEKQTGEKLLHIVQNNMDFTATFSSLGESISQGDSLWDGVEALLLELFSEPKEADPVLNHVVVLDGPAYKSTIQRIAAPVTSGSMVRLLDTKAEKFIMSEDTTEPETLEIQEEQEADRSTAIEEVLLMESKPETVQPEPPVYNGPDLPDNASMECFALGLSTVRTPVLGEISSGFGYRDHPITHENSFHTGVDISADIGTPIAAFADGIVEFIGESDAYGLYIQLDHGNGVKSFYCHCSELLYGKGTEIEAGQTIALVGDTGDTTGSHLHLEVKKGGILLNPAYYIESVD